MQINYMTVYSPKITRPLNLAVCPDFHDGDASPVLAACKELDAILIVGDLVDRHARKTNGYDHAVEFLREAPKIAPTFYSVGNHERKLPRRQEYWPHVESSDVTLLDDRFVEFGGIVLGGLSSRKGKPQTAWLAELARREEFRLLMCHHPEYFKKYVRPYGLDLTLAGHAHGGQVRIGGQGIYAPNQGLFPRWTSGFYFDDRLLVSRGVTNATWAPRINCPCELIILRLAPKEEQHA